MHADRSSRSVRPSPALVALLAPALFVAGCQARTPANGAPALDAQPAIGAFGLDLDGMEPAVAPGDDFFAYANGAWLERTEIPPDRSVWSSFSIVDDLAKRRTRAIVEEAAGDPRAQGARKQIGDFFAAWMDADAIEARGLEPLRGELDAIAGLRDARALARYLGTTLRADVDLLNATDWTTDRLFGLWVTQDLERPEATAPYLVQGGLGMPERSFYLDDDMAETRQRYREHAVRVLALAGNQDAQAAADRILALEVAIARVHASAEDTADVKKGANVWRRADFAAQAPGLDWEAFLAGAGLAGQDRFFVWQPGAASGIAALVASQPLAVWKEYLAFRALERASPLLPRAFADESFAFYGAVLDGRPEEAPRWRRALVAVDGALGEALGRLYVERHFPPETKARAEAMVADLLAAFGERIDRLDWMAAETKKHARAKLATMKVAVGHPERWHDVSGLVVRRDDALGNAERAERFRYERELAKLGRPADHDEWFLLPHEVNALNIPIENRLLFPAAILEAPFFDAAADDAVNYGAIGAVIGHEISHSFDSSGALFDEHGRLANWWTPEDLARFEAASAALVAQYDAYRPLSDLAVNGTLTLGENIADVAGLATAFDGWRRSQRGKPARVLGGFTPEQRFFLSYGQVWRSKLREQALRVRLLTDGHAPASCRVRTVRNLDAWYDAFDVRPGATLWLAPDERVQVW